jgi:hypothetical protein
VGGGGEGRQDLLLGGSWRRHEIILDEMYCLVQYLTMLAVPNQQAEHPLGGHGRSSTVV